MLAPSLSRLCRTLPNVVCKHTSKRLLPHIHRAVLSPPRSTRRISCANSLNSPSQTPASRGPSWWSTSSKFDKLGLMLYTHPWSQTEPADRAPRSSCVWTAVVHSSYWCDVVRSAGNENGCLCPSASKDDSEVEAKKKFEGWVGVG